MPSGHAVVDGSNIATEGRSEPSLEQLREAVAAFADEYDFEIITVIVDASFEHRVAKRERKAARAAIDDNEIITPPAGVIGRGDTFILQVADRADAVVVSNDSFQEFHGIYPWLFEEGRLIGGKPIPGLGWVYVPRAPVKGPVSRRARAQANGDDTAKAPAKKTRKAAKKATKKSSEKTSRKATETAATDETEATSAEQPAASAGDETRGRRSRGRGRGRGKAKDERVDTAPDVPGANPAGVWKAFRRNHPLGSTVTATVESFSSHGAYARSGDASVYLPLRLLGDPTPRRARDAVTVGESRSFIVHRFDEERRGIDAGIVPFGRSTDQTEASTEQSDPKTPTKGRTVAAKKAAKKSAKKSAKKAPAKKAAAKKAVKKAPAKKAAKKSTKKAAKKAPAKKAGAKKAAKKSAKKTAKKATKKSTKKAAKKTPAKKAAKKRPAKKAPAKKAGAKKAAKKSAKKTAKKATKKRR